jgi:hypothetical protein
LVEKAFHDDNPAVFAEVRWTPLGRPFRGIGWDPSHSPSPDDLIRMHEGVRLLSNINEILAIAKGGRPRIEDEKEDGKLELAREAKRLQRENPWMTVKNAAVRLGLPDYDRSSEPGADARAELAAERKLYRWLALLNKNDAAQ